MSSVDPFLRIFPDPILRKPCRRVSFGGATDEESLAELIQNLIRVLKSQKHGIGIAAPQIGYDLAVAIMDLSSRDPNARRQILINPVILEAWDEGPSREGCMSLPDYRGDIRRAQKILLQWQDITGSKHEQKFEGLEAVCIQHEVDHLNGKLFIDHIASLKRDLIPRSSSRR